MQSYSKSYWNPERNPTEIRREILVEIRSEIRRETLVEIRSEIRRKSYWNPEWNPERNPTEIRSDIRREIRCEILLKIHSKSGMKSYSKFTWNPEWNPIRNPLEIKSQMGLEILLKSGSGWHSVSSVIVSGHFRADTMMIPYRSWRILRHSLFFAGSRNRSDVAGSSTGKFRRENCFHLPCIFPAGSVVILTGKRQESAGIDLVSSRFRQDPLDGIIDLGTLQKRVPTKWIVWTN